MIRSLPVFPYPDLRTLTPALDRPVIGAPLRVGRLQIFPLLDPRSEGPTCMTSQQAWEEHCLEISEHPECARLPELEVVNHADLPVLLFEGTLLIGGRANRVLSDSVLVVPRSRATLPVACVEPGRWNGSPRIWSTGPSAPVRLRSLVSRSVTRSLRREARRCADQREVWKTITLLLENVDERPLSLDLLAAYAWHREAIHATQPLAQMRAGHQVGAVFTSSARGVLGMDLCSDPATFGRLYPSLLRGYALDVAGPLPFAPPARVQESTVELFLAQVAGLEASDHPGIAVGRELRLLGSGIAGAALTLDGEIVHLSAFPVHAGSRSA